MLHLMLKNEKKNAKINKYRNKNSNNKIKIKNKNK